MPKKDHQRKIYKVRLDLGNQTTSSLYEYFIEESALIRAIQQDPEELQKGTPVYPNNHYYFICQPNLIKLGLLLRLHASKQTNHPFNDYHAKQNILINLHFDKDKIFLHYLDANSDLRSTYINIQKELPFVDQNRLHYEIDTTQSTRNLPLENFAANLAPFDCPDNFHIHFPSPCNEVENFLSEYADTIKFLNSQYEINNNFLKVCDKYLAAKEEKPMKTEASDKKDYSALGVISSQIKHLAENRSKLTNNLYKSIAQLSTVISAQEVKEINEANFATQEYESIHAKLVAALQNAAIEYAFLKFSTPLNKNKLPELIRFRDEFKTKFNAIAEIVINATPSSKDTSLNLTFCSDLHLKTFAELEVIFAKVKTECRFRSDAKTIIEKYYGSLRTKYQNEIQQIEKQYDLLLFKNKKHDFDAQKENILAIKRDLLTLRVMLLNIFIFYFESIKANYIKKHLEHKLNALEQMMLTSSVNLQTEKIHLQNLSNSLEKTIDATLLSFNNAIKSVTSTYDENSSLLATSNLDINETFESCHAIVNKCNKEYEKVLESAQQKIIIEEKRQLTIRMQKAKEENLVQPQLNVANVRPKIISIFAPPKPLFSEAIMKLQKIFAAAMQIDFWHAQVSFGGSAIPLFDTEHVGQKIAVPRFIYDLLKIIAANEVAMKVIRRENNFSAKDNENAQKILSAINLKVIDAEQRQLKRCFNLRKEPTQLFINEVKKLLHADQTRFDFDTVIATYNNTHKIKSNKQIDFFSLVPSLPSLRKM